MGGERRSGNAGGGVGISGFLFAGGVGDAVAFSLVGGLRSPLPGFVAVGF